MQAVLILLLNSLLAVGAGISVVTQQAINANLRTGLNSAAWAGVVSYLVGLVCMLAFAFVMRDTVPSISTVLRSNWWTWTGGLFGAIFIALSILLVPKLGAASFIALLVGGQMLASMTIDHYGFFGIPQHPADTSRVLGAILLVAGVVLIRR